MKKIAWTLIMAGLLSAPAWAGQPMAVGYKVTQRYTLGGAGGWDYVTLDAPAHRLFIARDNRVMVVDTDSGKLVKEIPGMKHVHGIALVDDLHRAYVSNGHGNDVSVVDLDTLKVIGTIPVSGKGPDAIIYEPATKHVLTMNGDSNNISVIDPVKSKEIATIPVAGNPEFAVSDGNGNVYLNLEDKGELTHVDIKAGKVLDTWSLAPCEGPTGLALDTAGKRLFSVCANGWMIVTDADNGHQVAKIAVGKGPDGAIYDAQRHDIFSSSREGMLNVIHQDSPDQYAKLADVPTMKSVRTMAMDAASRKIYLVGAKALERGKTVSGFSLLVVSGE